MSLYYGYQENENKSSDSDDLERKIARLEKIVNGVRFSRVFNYLDLKTNRIYPSQSKDWPQSPISLTNPSNNATLRIVSLTLDNDDKGKLSQSSVIQIGLYVVYRDDSRSTVKLYDMYNIDYTERVIQSYKTYQLDIDVVLSDIITNTIDVQYLFPYLVQIAGTTYGFECSLVLQYTDDG